MSTSSAVVVPLTAKKSTVTFKRKARRIRRSFSTLKYQKALREHKYVRSCTNNLLSLTVGGSQTASQGGFANTGKYSMSLSFSPGFVSVYLDGSLYGSLAIPGVTELQGLYDQYRMDWVEVKIGFNINSAQSNAGNNANLPFLWVAKDYDDINGSTTTDLNQYDNVRCIALGQNAGSDPWYTFKLKPRCNTLVSSAQGSSTYAIAPMFGKNNPFIDCGNMAVEHFGMKMAYFNPIQPANTTVYGSIILQVKTYLTMKNVR